MTIAQSCTHCERAARASAPFAAEPVTLSERQAEVREIKVLPFWRHQDGIRELGHQRAGHAFRDMAAGCRGWNQRAEIS